MRNLKCFMLCLLAALLVMPASVNGQEKKKKKKKQKKEFVWDWDKKKSGNEDVDSYLMACDSLWTKMSQYQENITAYEMKEDTLLVGDDFYQVLHMENAEGKLLTKGAVNWQLVESVSTGLMIVANSVQIGTQTATATLALPKLGLSAFSYGKYVKAGPLIIAKAGKEIKDIVLMRKEQMSKWKSMKEAAVDPRILNLNLDEASLKKMEKCFFVRKIEEKETGYDEVKTQYSQRPKEEIDQKNKTFADNLSNSEELPENEDNHISDDDFNEKAAAAQAESV